MKNTNLAYLGSCLGVGFLLGIIYNLGVSDGRGETIKAFGDGLKAVAESVPEKAEE